MSIGLVIAPRALLRAFAWGRRSRNLYHGEVGDELLDLRLGQLRRRLGLDASPPEPRAGDVLRLAGWLLVATPILLGAVALFLAPLLVPLWLLLG